MSPRLMMSPRLTIAVASLLLLGLPPLATPAMAQDGDGRPEFLATAAVEREYARDVDAHRRAPLTFAYADSLFARAETAYAEQPDSPEPARTLAGEAADEYRHASRLALLADSISDRKVSPEQILLRHEARLAELAAVLEFTPDFAADGTDEVQAVALEAAHRLQRDRRDLSEDLATRIAEVSRLQRQVDSLEESLAEAGRREADMAAVLAERERTKQRLREVRAVFDPDEAEVLVSDDRVTIRLSGLTFASGSAELGPENSNLLTKLERVVREFPGAGIVVEGHTDSVGDAAANQALSRRRAISVRDYLLTAVAMSADRVTAIGYGSDRPIAPNDTAAGRARNRRIDVTIDTGGG